MDDRMLRKKRILFWLIAFISISQWVTKYAQTPTAAVALAATSMPPRAYLPLVEKSCPTSVSFYQETDPSVVLDGTWLNHADDHASGGAYLASSTTGDAVHFTFCGDSVTLYRRMDTDGGFADVSIDGVYRQFLLFYFLERRWQVPAVIDNLGEGPHTITVRVSNTTYPPSTGQQVYIDAFAVPNPYAATVAQQHALEQYNWYRQVAGIPLVKMSGALNLAAQSHADYIRINGWNSPTPHGEDPAYPGFTGDSSTDRGMYFGHDWITVDEGMHWLGDTTAAIDEIMAAPLHRASLMTYDLVAMGTGLNTGANRNDALETGFGLSVSVPARILYTYPANGQVDVPNSWRDIEVPDVLPPGTPKPVGYPISLHIKYPGPSIYNDPRVDLAELRDSNGQLVSIFISSQLTSAVPTFLIATSPLALGATYTAHVAGLDRDGVPFDHSWSFTTTTACRWVFCD